LILENIAVRLENSFIKREAKGRTVTLKMKYFDFQYRQLPLPFKFPNAKVNDFKLW
jgi:hypothetical protein